MKLRIHASGDTKSPGRRFESLTTIGRIIAIKKEIRVEKEVQLSFNLCGSAIYTEGMTKTPIYGTSFHYSDQAGSDYLAWQDALGEINGKIDSRKFSNFDFTNSTLLDFGCGTGNLLKNLRAKESIAVEVNLHAHSKLKQNNYSSYLKNIIQEETGVLFEV